MAENECTLVIEVEIEGCIILKWLKKSAPSLMKLNFSVPTLPIYVSCVHIVKIFIQCFLTGFPETMSDPSVSETVKEPINVPSVK